MKPFYGIDLTENKKNEVANGKELLVATPSMAMSQALHTSAEKADETVTRAKLPLALQIAQWVCGGAAVIIAAGILRGTFKKDGTTFAQAYENAPWLFWIFGFCLAVWVILKIIGNRKEKNVLESDGHTLSHFESVCSSVFTELSVPADAKEVDILSFFYKIKDGEIKVCERSMQLFSHMNCCFKVFTDTDTLYLASLDGKYAIPLTSLLAIRAQDKKVRISGWNKAEAPTEGIYAQYKMNTDQFGCIHAKPHYILEFRHSGETWGIYFPCYELPVFETLTGLKAE